MNSEVNPGEMMALAATQAIKLLLSVKVSFERLERYLDIHGVSGTYHGVDIYEIVQGVHDSVAGAIGFLLPPEEEKRVRSAVFGDDDREFEKRCSEIEDRECGHA